MAENSSSANKAFSSGNSIARLILLTKALAMFLLISNPAWNVSLNPVSNSQSFVDGQTLGSCKKIHYHFAFLFDCYTLNIDLKFIFISDHNFYKSVFMIKPLM